MSQDTSPFTRRLATNARTVEGLLERLLGQTTEADEIARPANLLAAMRHGVLNGGKRLRPFLVIECADLLGGNRDAALRVGAALECVHCYSLVHDDLPAMDDDDMRRGQPTVHRAFDEATAILAGDSLLTFAFDIIAAPETALSDAQKVELILALGRAAGHGGMAGGQALDLAAEKSPPDEAGIVTLQAMKTGALIRFACEAGAIVAGASKEDRARLRAFGEKIGLAFQLADDLLDLTADAETMGKATGKDAARGKGTLVALNGQTWAEDRLEQLVVEAEALLAPYGARSAILVEAARFIANRRS
ncbi:polyprenyl synthetase family protein [Ensifer sp. ENS07]|jgi:farnesyl diphosphate synthase|uniref:Probable farnesyl diphosphate synthase n=1 Tax=Ensifer adhaerens TaxID=106592 RepID=A0A9Q8Y619_ENSAD|nr:MULTISPECIES: farnesyl diphosphate synthase [Ensifer]MBD9558160.1 polyprenyl synthetase family protein [Ensifer sp. ENS03]MBD9593313.1 polyprenyl synthetase family protein [Ensifer sp. ENS05]MBD9639736.1 polyprenyl synthetase family protein [Ensifer sp. ENS07]USJ22983.1 polyprenyl synthetase family protein [Ensifer adhaerens]UTV36308.1 polyprenyl synthetase family protein [Ensifer adhaerens]